MIRPLLLFSAIFFAHTALAVDFATQVLDATFKFFDPDCTGTCVFVRRDAPDDALYLVTAAHVFEGVKKDTAIVVLRQPKDDGSFERHDHTITIRRDGKPLWVRHEKQDVAVLRIAEPLPIPVAGIPISEVADEARRKTANVHVCSPLFVLTYPQRTEANPAGFPIAREGIFSSPPLLPARIYPIYYAEFTTFAGDSGGPVFVAGADDHPLLVGIVLGQYRHDEEVKTEYEEIMIHHPLRLGMVVHPEFVRQTIEAAARQCAAP